MRRSKANVRASRANLTATGDQTLSEVRGVFAEVTRYPAEILEPQADVEEDLGIDSVKLGEILSVLRERFALPPTNEIRTRVPAAQLRTIAGIASAVQSLKGSGGIAGAASTQSRSPEPAAIAHSSAFPAPPAPSATSAPSLTDQVRAIFAELTRYPSDILAPDADLEEELGIDSVKLGEIFSVLRERFALPPRSELRDRITPAQLRSIGGITEIVRTFGDVTAAEPAASGISVAPLAPPPTTAPVVPIAAVPPIAALAVPASDRANGRSRTVTWADPAIGAAAARSMTGLDYLRAVMRGDLPHPPITHLMGYVLVEAEHGRAVYEAEPAEFHYNLIGRVHAALAAALLDSAMGSAVLSTLPLGGGHATVDLNVHLVRPITSETTRLRCTGEVVHSGSRMATAQARLVDLEGRLYAHATETCLIINQGASQ